MKNNTQKKIGKRNKSNEIATNCWLSTYKRLRSKKTNYMFLNPKNKRKKQETK